MAVTDRYALVLRCTTFRSWKGPQRPTDQILQVTGCTESGLLPLCPRSSWGGVWAQMGSAPEDVIGQTRTWEEVHHRTACKGDQPTEGKANVFSSQCDPISLKSRMGTRSLETAFQPASPRHPHPQHRGADTRASAARGTRPRQPPSRGRGAHELRQRHSLAHSTARKRDTHHPRHPHGGCHTHRAE